MMKHIALAIGVSLASAHISAVRADWQYTHWGMSPDEVVDASKGKAVKPTATELENWKTDEFSPGLKAPYVVGKFVFAAVFYFDSDEHLAMVDLKLINNPQLAPGLLGELKSKYGNPDEAMSGSVYEGYVWRTATDQVVLFAIGFDGDYTNVSIQYRPRLTGTSEGL